MKWHYTKDGDLPSGNRDHIICLADTKHGYMLLGYNTYEQCWDDGECDDYYCDAYNVERWCSLKEIVDSFDA
jgi:hypothetical protein